MPCNLITSEEAETLLARPVGKPTTEPDRCTWSATDGKGFVAVTLSRSDASRTMLDASQASDRGESVKGIGEQAYVALPGADLGIVAFINGPLSVSILVRSPTRERTALLDLAGLAARRA